MIIHNYAATWPYIIYNYNKNIYLLFALDCYVRHLFGGSLKELLKSIMHANCKLVYITFNL